MLSADPPTPRPWLRAVHQGYTERIDLRLRHLLLGPVLAASLADCADPGSLVLPWPDADTSVAFLLSAAGGQLKKIDGPYLASEVAFAPIHVEVETDAELSLLAFREEGLRSVDPRIALDRLGEARLDVAMLECPEGTLGADGEFRVALEQVQHQLLVPEASGAWVASADPGNLSGVVLRAPFDDERPCRPDRVRFSRFMQNDRVLPDGTVVDGSPRNLDVRSDAEAYFGLSSLAWLDETRAVYANPGRFYVLERGEVFVDVPGRHVPLSAIVSSLPGVGWSISRVRNDPTYDVPGRSKVWVSLLTRTQRPSNTKNGALVEAILSDAGVESVRTATLTTSTISSLEIGADGGLIIGGKFHSGEGAVLMFGSVFGGIDQVFVRSDLPGAFDRIIATGDAAVPYLAPLDTHLFAVHRTAGGALEVQHWSDGRVASIIRSVAIRRTERGVESWIGTYSSGLFRRDPDGVWTQMLVALPESAAICGGTNRRCGRRTMENVVFTMAQLGDGRLGLGIEGCDALLVLDPGNLCLDAVPEGDQTIERPTYNRLSYSAASKFGALFGGSDSSLRVATIE